MSDTEADLTTKIEGILAPAIDTRATYAKHMIKALAGLIEADLSTRDAFVTAKALQMAAKVAGEAALVPPDGGSPTQGECDVADRAKAAILALSPDTGAKP